MVSSPPPPPPSHKKTQKPQKRLRGRERCFSVKFLKKWLERETEWHADSDTDTDTSPCFWGRRGKKQQCGYLMPRIFTAYFDPAFDHLLELLITHLMKPAPSQPASSKRGLLSQVSTQKRGIFTDQHISTLQETSRNLGFDPIGSVTSGSLHQVPYSSVTLCWPHLLSVTPRAHLLPAYAIIGSFL